MENLGTPSISIRRQPQPSAIQGCKYMSSLQDKDDTRADVIVSEPQEVLHIMCSNDLLGEQACEASCPV